jgi:hypothetical protein
MSTNKNKVQNSDDMNCSDEKSDNEFENKNLLSGLRSPFRKKRSVK